MRYQHRMSRQWDTKSRADARIGAQAYHDVIPGARPRDPSINALRSMRMAGSRRPSEQVRGQASAGMTGVRVGRYASPVIPEFAKRISGTQEQQIERLVLVAPGSRRSGFALGRDDKILPLADPKILSSSGLSRGPSAPQAPERADGWIPATSAGMTIEPSMICLRPARPEDRFLIRRWLHEPEVSIWRGNTASAEAEITLALQSPSALPRIVDRDGDPVGYAHAVEMALFSASLPEGLPAGTWEADYFLGAAADNPKLGETVLALLTEEVFTTTLAVACSATVSIRNEAAVRCFERTGFRWIRVVQEPSLGSCWLMLKERSSH